MPKQARALADVLDDHEMLVELAPWPGAEVLSEIFRAVKGWTVGSSNPAAPGEFERGVEKRIGELVCVAGWIANDLREALETIRGVLVRPELAHSPAAVLAYTQVEAWAEENRLPVTRCCFAALAGLSSPDDFRNLRRVGLLARDLARWSAARAWLEHAASVAGRQRAWDEHILAVLSIGNMLCRQGLYKQARRVFVSALGLARKHSLEEMQGMALHDLMMTAREARDLPAAEQYARLALVAYGPAHANVPALAYDLAYLWLSEGYPGQALSVFQAVLPHFESRPGHRIRVLASMAHAAAAVGDIAQFDKAFGRARETSRDPAAAAALASSLLELAYASIAAAHWDAAEVVTNAALQVATSRREVDVIARADALLKTVVARCASSNPKARYSGVHSDENGASPIRAASEALAESLVRSVIAKDVLRSVEIARLGPSVADLRRQESAPLTHSRAAQGTHTVFRRCAWSSRVLEYATYRPASSTPGSVAWERVLHAELEGSPSFNRTTRRNVASPHVHDPSVPGGVREARPDEIPRRPW